MIFHVTTFYAGLGQSRLSAMTQAFYEYLSVTSDYLH